MANTITNKKMISSSVVSIKICAYHTTANPNNKGDLKCTK